MMDMIRRALMLATLVTTCACGSQHDSAAVTPEKDSISEIRCVVQLPAGWSAEKERVRGPATFEFKGSASLASPSGKTLTLRGFVAETEQELKELERFFDSPTTPGEIRGPLAGSDGFEGMYSVFRKHRAGGPPALIFQAMKVHQNHSICLMASVVHIAVRGLESESDRIPPDEEVTDMIRIAESMRPLLEDEGRDATKR